MANLFSMDLYLSLCILFCICNHLLQNKWFQSLLQLHRSFIRSLDPAERKIGIGCLERALALGSDEAIGRLSLRLYAGGIINGVEQNRYRAVQLAIHGSSLSPPDPFSVAELGWYYRFGTEGFPRDLEKARQLFQQSADMDCPNGCLYLAWLYQDMNSHHDLQIDLRHRAAERDHLGAMLELGSIYLRNADSAQAEKGLKLLTQAADRGHPSAMCSLAEYLQVEANPSQLERARLLYQQAARLGLPKALAALQKAPFV